MAINKITNAERDEVKISGLPDKPGLTKEAIQQRFDGLGNLAIDKINEVIDNVNETEKEIKDLDTRVDQIANNQIPEEYLQASVDAYIEGNEGGLATKTDLEELDSNLSSEIAEIQNFFRTENLFNKDDSGNEFGRFIDMNGYWNDNDSVFETHYIPVEAGETYIFYATSNIISKDNAKVWYDENKTKISITYGQELNTAPPNAKYVRGVFGISRLNECMVVKSNVNVTDYIPYYQTAQITDNNHWKGKSWYAYGTSITSIAQGKYVDYVAQFSGLIATNKGIPGGGITNLGGYSTGQVKDAIMNTTDGKLNADLITLEVGANEGGELGNKYDTDDSTFCGCLNQCLRYLQANTNAQIAVMYSVQHKTEPNENILYWEREEKVREVCNINNVYYLGDSSGLGYARISKDTTYTIDDIHQTELGGYNLAQFMWSKLKDIPLWYSALPN